MAAPFQTLRYIRLFSRFAKSYIPDPFLRIYVETIHAGKHGSDSGVFDTEGRFLPCKFEDMWCKVGRSLSRV